VSTAAASAPAGRTGEISRFYDVALEALSYLQDGAWSGFEDAVESVSSAHEPPEESAREVARTMAALGHIDVMVDRYTFRPRKWSIAPPALLSLPDGSMILCGHRPSGLIDALQSDAARRRYGVTVERLALQPARVVVNPPAGGKAESVAEALRDASYEVSVNSGGAGVLARTLPPLDDVIDSLRRASPPYGGTIERLRIEGGRLKWTQASDYAVPGSYRFNPPPVVYGYVESANAAPARVDARLARLLALRDAGQQLFAWDPETKLGYARYYAEPPGLYERALALCSGYAPVTRPREGITEYRGVTEEVALTLHRALLPDPTRTEVE
jgi:hypothetical protein